MLAVGQAFFQSSVLKRVQNGYDSCVDATLIFMFVLENFDISCLQKIWNAVKNVACACCMYMFRRPQGCFLQNIIFLTGIRCRCK